MYIFKTLSADNKSFFAIGQCRKIIYANNIFYVIHFTQVHLFHSLFFEWIIENIQYISKEHKKIIVSVLCYIISYSYFQFFY